MVFVFFVGGVLKCFEFGDNILMEMLVCEFEVEVVDVELFL